mmetsp:Transcript_88500/g.235512  ORF Transcript_88500/g.235512 Transcript_88500/m.235512 type:complete len:518 (-) Transcript_88500:806-2359(-)
MQNTGLPATTSIKLRFSRCGVVIKSRRLKRNEKNLKEEDAQKWILREVTDEVDGGRFLAILGPSGSGKTTLLSLLTLSLSTGAPSGVVTLNGHPLNSSILEQCCAFMPQESNLWPFLTCREVLSYAADFYMSDSAAEKKDEVDRTLKHLGLEGCANTLCGNRFVKGLSGGQKRRLSLGLALIKKPLVLFLDEPTSGLDSTSATWIVDFLKKLSKDEGIAVVCTIHQPSTAIFQKFDSMLLLSNGRSAYSGLAEQAVPYFQQTFGRAMPKDYSAAEFVLDFINSDFGEEGKKEEVERVLEAWDQRYIEEHAAMAHERTPLPERRQKSASFRSQILVHLRRQSLLSLRDPILYVSRVVIFVVCCIFFAWVYADARFRNQDQVNPLSSSESGLGCSARACLLSLPGSTESTSLLVTCAAPVPGAGGQPGVPVHVGHGGADVHGRHRRLRLQPGAHRAAPRDQGRHVLGPLLRHRQRHPPDPLHAPPRHVGPRHRPVLHLQLPRPALRLRAARLQPVALGV